MPYSVGVPRGGARRRVASGRRGGEREGQSHPALRIRLRRRHGSRRYGASFGAKASVKAPNDQAFVEQKNGAVVRRLVGYGRFDGVETARVMARLYAAARLRASRRYCSSPRRRKSSRPCCMKKAVRRKACLISCRELPRWPAGSRAYRGRMDRLRKWPSVPLSTHRPTVPWASEPRFRS